MRIHPQTKRSYATLHLTHPPFIFCVCSVTLTTLAQKKGKRGTSPSLTKQATHKLRPTHRQSQSQSQQPAPPPPPPTQTQTLGVVGTQPPIAPPIVVPPSHPIIVPIGTKTRQKPSVVAPPPKRPRFNPPLPPTLPPPPSSTRNYHFFRTF